MILGWVLIGLGVYGAYAGYTGALAKISGGLRLWLAFQAGGVLIAGCVGLIVLGSVLVAG